MTSELPGAETAQWIADRIKAKEPWDVYAEKSRRYEVHFTGSTLELIHGPITLQGFGVRLLRSRDGKTGTGFQASTDLSDEGVRSAVADAERICRFSEFPAKRVELPTGRDRTPAGPKIVDQELWSRPLEAVEGYFAALISAFEKHRGVAPSFGSVKATLTETSIANSAGLRAAYPQTTVELEVGVKAFGGPEGAPPGEYWVNETSRRLDSAALPAAVDAWCQYAQDVRRAVPPPSGDLAVVLPASVLSGILPATLGFKLSGAARLRNISPAIGEKIAPESVTIRDEGRYDWGPLATPVDDEGTPQKSRTLVGAGLVEQIVYDSLYGAAFDSPSTASAVRAAFGGTLSWKRFTRAPSPGSSTLVVAPGDGGSDAELIEAAGDGVWVQQLGWASPYGLTSMFGGEIRIGYRIRNGKLAEPVRGGVVGGVVLAPPGSASMLANVAALGSSVELSDGVASPAMLVRPLSVAGGVS